MFTSAGLGLSWRIATPRWCGAITSQSGRSNDWSSSPEGDGAGLAMESITHVVVGFSEFLIAKLDALLPPRSVLVLEEPRVAASRNAEAKLRGHRCVARLAHAPTQDEHHVDELVASVARPPHVVAVVPGVEYGVVAA